MPALVAGIHAFAAKSKTWMAGTSPAMTSFQAAFNTSCSVLVAQPLRQVVELIEIAVADADHAALAAMIDADDKPERIG
jgi:hypothetical protein